jgi:hypothetical protein
MLRCPYFCGALKGGKKEADGLSTLRALPNQVLARLDELELELDDLALPEASTTRCCTSSGW